MENRALSTGSARSERIPNSRSKAQQTSHFPPAGHRRAPKQDVLWDVKHKKWRDAKGLVEAWLQVRQGGKQLAPSKVCSYAFMIGRDLRNAVSHPTLNPSKASIRKVYDLAAPYFIELAEVAIRATIEHPQTDTTGRMIAYRFFLYPYLKNSDSFLSDYYLERLLPDAELAAFPEDDGEGSAQGHQKGIGCPRQPAAAGRRCCAHDCRLVSAGALSRPGPRSPARRHHRDGGGGLRADLRAAR